MSLVRRAIWYMESHYTEDINLEDVADGVGVSRYHLIRAFGVATGYSVVQYLRARRLSVAAQLLVNDCTMSILDIAVSSGYGSHEAFTRAFIKQFGVTPELIRRQLHVANLDLVEPLYTEQSQSQYLETDEPKICVKPAFLVAGMHEHYGDDASVRIPALWQQFHPYMNLPQRIGGDSYGICSGDNDGCAVNYFCGVEVESEPYSISQLETMRIQEQHYAVFPHREHIASINQTFNYIWSEWLPQSGCIPVNAPSFELYHGNFDRQSGFGGVEIWIPVQ